MPFIVDDEEKKQNEQNSPTNNQMNLGPESSALQTDGAGNAQDASQPNKQTASGAFTNIQQYLSKNEDQAEPLADKVTKPITDLTSQAQSSAQSGKDKFSNEVQQNTVQKDDNVLGDLNNYQPSKLANYGDIYTPFEPNTKLQGIANDPNQKSSVDKMRTAEYKGPKDINQGDYLTQARTQYNQANQIADLTNTEGGRYQLLGQAVGSPTYTQGQHQLDQTILQNSAPAASKLQQVRNQVSALPGQIDQRAMEANALVAPAEQTTAQTRQAAMDALNGVQGRYNAELDSRVQNALAQRAQAVSSVTDAANKDFAFQDPSANHPSFYDQIGLNNPNFLNVDRSKFITPDQQPADHNTIAQQYDVPEAQALAQLMGTSDANPYATLFNTDQELNSYRPTPAFDKRSYQDAVLDKARGMQSEINSALKDYKQYEGNYDFGKLSQGMSDESAGKPISQGDATRYWEVLQPLWNEASRVYNIEKSYGMNPKQGLVGNDGYHPKETYDSINNILGLDYRQTPLTTLTDPNLASIRQYLGLDNPGTPATDRIR